MRTHTPDRLAAAALLLGGAGFIVTMSIHPTGVHLGSPADLAAQAFLTRLAHGIALVALPLTLFGLAAFSRRMGLRRPSALAGLVFFAVAVASVMNAALMSGFVQASLMDAYVGASPAERALLPRLMDYTHMLNQAWAMVFSAASAAAIGLWSLGLLSTRGSRAAGWLGLAVAVGGLLLLALGGHDALSVHGYMLVALGEGAWLARVALMLWRGWSPPDALAAD
ncbi:MAG: hypothetical protein K1X35_04530 [Caulobacteraceae bacterium]|nr:hypothetical protein [Caulobacteraceae bacterium]